MPPISNKPYDQPFDFDVAVVGYGPVGMTFAILMALRNFRVCVFERHKERWKEPRHGHVDGQIMRIMQDIGIAQDVEKIGRAVTEFEIRSAEGKTIQSVKTSEADGSGWKKAYMMSSVELEDHLDVRARSLGVRVFMGCQVSGLEQDTNGVRVSALNILDDSPIQAIRAQYVVGSDGANSFIRSHLGISRTEIPFAKVEHLVIDVEHHDPDREIDNLECNAHVLSPGRQYLAGRWEGGQWSRWEFARNKDEPIEELQKRSTCWKLLAPWSVGHENAVIRRHSLYTFEARMADNWREGRVFLTGDAAHTTPPHLGQGMCSGVRDAANLAWKMSAVLEGTAGPEILETYQQERAPHVEAITKMAIGIGMALQKAQQLMSEPSKAEEFLRAPQTPKFPKIHGSSLLGGGTFQGIGRPMLQGRVLHQGRIALLGDFLPHGWTIITRQHLPRNIWTRQHHDALVRYGVTIAHVSRGSSAEYIDLDGDYDVWYRTNKKKAVLVRPDHYVFDAGDLSTSAIDLVDQLAAAMGSFSARRDG